MVTLSNYGQIEKLIENGDKVQAERLLKSMLYKDSRNPQAWWLYTKVAEDNAQLYQILIALTDLPTNEYTGRARALLSRMPYQATKNSSRSVLHSKRRISSLSFLAGLLGVAIIGIGVVVLSPLSKQQTVAAGAIAIRPSATSQVQQNTSGSQLQVQFKSTLPPSWTPVPSSTPQPTRVVALETTSPSAATLTPTTMADSDSLTNAYQKFSDHTTALYKVADDTISLLIATDKISDDTNDTISKQTDLIRQLRNDIMVMNTNNLPTNLRRSAFLPAAQAYASYANSVLQWIDLELQLKQQAIPVGLSTATASPLERKNRLSEQKKLLDNQTSVLTTNRKALQSSLVDFSILTNSEILKAQLSARAFVVDSNYPTILSLNSGVYQFSCKVDTNNPAKVTFWLVPVNSSASKVKLNTNPLKGNTCSNQTVQLAGGSYQIQVDLANWWVIGFDPQP